ncbi:hypothetical protein Y032_0101g3367 [Ancylostoma ceylanicum]|uniref:Fibronectin type-III domain-containing protein n=1 Tax=Ancylostoma ceylanicum TaxID=53326 RepID=A0A016THK9_9BILA|nr:hypothetical protein Y032_0101g3367 [Ancylostoma ceylanicum]
MLTLIQAYSVKKSGVRNVQVTNVTDNMAIVRWDVRNEETTRIGTFKIVVANKYRDVVHTGTVRRKRWYKMKQLQPSTNYIVTVIAAGANASRTFRTEGVISKPERPWLQESIKAEVRGNSVIVRWFATCIDKCYIRYFKILCCIDGTNDCLLNSIVDGWRDSYTLNPVPHDTSLKISLLPFIVIEFDAVYENWSITISTYYAIVSRLASSA